MNTQMGLAPSSLPVHLMRGGHLTGDVLPASHRSSSPLRSERANKAVGYVEDCVRFCVQR